ncbi:MAG: hypothetical protein H0V81_11070 [Solirubrobacterales bacterium]|nr:hypothetical protein [Solirubrobacterales bacterium]
MSKMIQVRNVSDEAHRVLKTRAAAAGMSLSDYIRVDLEAAASKPTWEEIAAEVRAEPRSGVTRAQIVADLREIRGA